jgi:acyl-[acyl-carrier-protein]-phospholipid O-acyltransferase/long-chain-fatty-acid--[acyl-carrier-protein] ligase
MAVGNYSGLLKQKGFTHFLLAQFLGAFNDNVCKWIVTFYAIDRSLGHGSKFTALTGALFVVPFIFFSSYAGHLADAYSKRSVLVTVKGLEIIVMGLAFFAMGSGDLRFMLFILFLMALHSTFFSPAKYGILPELLPEKNLSRANGLLEMTTFLAIILGTSLGGLLYAHWKNQPSRLNLVLLAVAVAGWLFSRGIPRVPAAAPHAPFRWNPFGEITTGLRDLRKNPILWQTTLGISYFWFLGSFLLAAIAPLGKEVMGLPDNQTAILETFLALGIGLGSLLAGKLSGDKVELGLVPLGSIGMGVFALGLFALCRHSYAWALLDLSCLGLCAGFFVVPLNSLLQQKSEKDEKGRILATNNFLNALGMLLSAGTLYLFAEVFHLNPDQSVLIMGFLTFGVTVYLLTVLPDFLIRFSLWLFTHTIYKIRIQGQQNVPFQGPALLVSNHVSLVDGLLVAACVQRFIRFMVFKPYYEHPVFHWLFKLMKAIPVGSSRADVTECLERAKAELKAGHVVCIFAEGGISRTGNLLPFKRGLEKIMEDQQAPIIPIHLDRVWGSIFSFKEGKFVTKWPLALPYPVTVSFGQPLPSTARAEEVRLAVQELGSDAVIHRRSLSDLLPLRFVKTAKRRWFSFAMADSGGKALSYGQALTASVLLAKWINRNSKGQTHVGLLLPASVGGALANLAVSLSGRVSVNLNFTTGAEGMALAQRECGIQTVLTSKLFLHKAGLATPEGAVYLEDLLRSFGPIAKTSALLQALFLPARLLSRILGGSDRTAESPATVIFSSGSTGTPKGVVLTHHNILSNLESIEQVLWVSGEDRVMGVLPFFHSFGFTGTLWLPLIAGFGAAYHPNPLDAATIGQMVEKYRATLLISTPTFYAAYLRKCSAEQFKTLRFAVVGAEKLRDALAAEFLEKFGLELMEGYGCTELSPVVSVNIPDFEQGRIRQKGRKPGTVGQPLPGVAVKIVDPDTGILLPAGQSGLLLVKGPNLMKGYLNQPEKTAEVLRNGWYVTGDLAVLDEDGFLKITDRLSRFSKIGGEMVPHGKVEEELAPHLEGHAAAVTAIPDEQKGEKLVVLHTHPTLKAAELWEKLSQSSLPKLWVPKKDCFHFVESLPLLGTGKLDLKGLKKTALELSSPKPGNQDTP